MVGSRRRATLEVVTSHVTNTASDHVDVSMCVRVCDVFDDTITMERSVSSISVDGWRGGWRLQFVTRYGRRLGVHIVYVHIIII